MTVTLFVFTALGLLAATFFRTKGSLQAGIAAFVISTGFWVFYELELQRIEPYPNIRVDLIVLIPLWLFVLSRLIFPGKPSHEKTLSSTQASRCLTLSLISTVAWMFPVLAIWSINQGHRALKGGLDNADRTKVILGLILAYVQIAAAMYLWLDIIFGKPL